ncbi:MAG: thiamine pyrophosphate-binding protein [Bacillota bacterium]|nr:thiamine pyrophosphate-binding protein [Bacillota bacterium]
MIVAQAILTQLANFGVKKIYGLVGDHIFQLVHELSDCPHHTFYPVRHEETASLMASAQAKLTGEIGVCLATGGPGAVHLLNGVADAYKDKVPLLAITGQEATKDLGTEKKQVINQTSLFAGITCFSEQIVHQQATGDVLARALSEAIANSLPAHIVIPKDILSQPYTGQIFASSPYLNTLPQSPPEVIKDAAARLSQAKAPVILVGKGGTVDSQEIMQLAEKWQAPVVLTSVAKAMFHHDHPLVLGGIGDGGSEAATNIMNRADVVLAIGANWWPEKYLSTNLTIIQLDSNPISLATNNPIAFGLVGDIRSMVEQLTKLIKKSAPKGWIEEVNKERANWLELINQELAQAGTPCPPASIIDGLNKTVASDAILTLDVGDHFVWFNRLFQGSGQTVLLSGKWRTLGFGLPAALVAKCHYPDKQVVALVGDGGFVMTMADFITAVKLNLPITVVVVNNKSFAMEQNKMVSQGFTPFATQLTNPDFKLFAESCGGVGYTVSDSHELEETLQRALATNKPCIVDVHTDTTPPPKPK